MFYELGISLALVWAMFCSVLLVVPYLVLRWRDTQYSPRDPQLGVKVAAHYLLTLSIFAVLVGLTIVVDDLLSGDNEPFLSDQKRQGLALALAGLLLSKVHVYVIKRKTNDDLWPMARRLFTGTRFILASMVVLVALSGLLVNVFVKSTRTSEETYTFLGVLAVWGPAMVAELWMLLAFTRQPNTPDVTSQRVEDPPAA